MPLLPFPSYDTFPWSLYLNYCEYDEYDEISLRHWGVPRASINPLFAEFDAGADAIIQVSSGLA